MENVIKKTINEYFNEIAIMVTIPKSIKWEDCLKEIEKVADGKSEMNFKVSSCPSKAKVGDKCFICHDGYVKGWMTISSICRKQFQCTTTGKQWEVGWYIGRTGEFHPIDGIKQKGFIGYRYINPNDYIK